MRDKGGEKVDGSKCVGSFCHSQGRLGLQLVVQTSTVQVQSKTFLFYKIFTFNAVQNKTTSTK